MIHDTRGLKVVVGDSDRTVLELLQIRLDLAGFHACVARNGPSVLEVLRNVRPAALVIDLGLPEIDGFGVLQAINPRREKLPFATLVIARKLSAEDIQRALRLGARDCMVKPFSGADVLERVARLLKPPPRPQPPASPATRPPPPEFAAYL